MSVHSTQNLSGFGNAVVLSSYVNPLTYCDFNCIHHISSHQKTIVDNFITTGLNVRFWWYHSPSVSWPLTRISNHCISEIASYTKEFWRKANSGLKYRKSNMSESQPMEDTTTRCSRPPTLILWILWAVLSLNILSVSHLKPGLRYVGDIWVPLK